MADPFWASDVERLTYEHAAEVNPRLPGEHGLIYIARLADIAKESLARQVAHVSGMAKATPERKAELLAAIGWQGEPEHAGEEV